MDRVAGILDRRAPPGSESAATSARPLALPSRRALRVYLTLGLAIDVVFLAVYGGGAWMSTWRGPGLPVHWQWELSIPFVPAMIWVYGSMFVLFLFPLFHLDARQLTVLGRQVLVATLASGAIFLLFPARLGFPERGEVPGYETVFNLIAAIDGPYNLLPSLHVVYSALIVFALWPVAEPIMRWFYGAWLAALVASVLLVHQHHLADVVAAFALVWACRHIIHRDMINSDKGDDI